MSVESGGGARGCADWQLATARAHSQNCTLVAVVPLPLIVTVVFAETDVVVPDFVYVTALGSNSG